jgi:hypothetical protein
MSPDSTNRLARKPLRTSTGHTSDHDLWDNPLNDEIRGASHRDEHLPNQDPSGY